MLIELPPTSSVLRLSPHMCAYVFVHASICPVPRPSSLSLPEVPWDFFFFFCKTGMWPWGTDTLDSSLISARRFWGVAGRSPAPPGENVMCLISALAEMARNRWLTPLATAARHSQRYTSGPQRAHNPSLAKEKGEKTVARLKETLPRSHSRHTLPPTVTEKQKESSETLCSSSHTKPHTAFFG